MVYYALAIDRPLTAIFLVVLETVLRRIDDVYGPSTFVQGVAWVFQQNLSPLAPQMLAQYDLIK